MNKTDCTQDSPSGRWIAMMYIVNIGALLALVVWAVLAKGTLNAGH